MEIFLNPKDGGQLGPYTIEQLNTEASAGRVASDDLAWIKGSPSSQPLSTVPGFKPPEDLLRLFVDKNYEYYVETWKLAEQKKGLALKLFGKNSWNWAAFFLMLNWMAYRKMYGYSLFVIVVLVVELIAVIATSVSVATFNFIRYFHFVLALAYGIHGNGWYKLHVQEKIREIAPTTGPSDEAFRIRVAKEGGTNLGAAVGFSAVMIILIILIEAFLR